MKKAGVIFAAVIVTILLFSNRVVTTPDPLISAIDPGYGDLD